MRKLERESDQPTLSCFLMCRAVKVKKEATPEDYNNEELYMEMDKIYFTVRF